MSFFSFRNTLASASLVTLMATTGAYAQSSRDAIVASIEAAAKAAGATEVSHGAVTGDDAKFTIADQKVVMKNGDKTTTVTVGSTTFTNAKQAAGGYSADRVEIAEVEIEADDSTASIEKIVVEGVVTPSAADLAAKKPGGKFDRLEIAKVEIESDDKTIPIDSVVVTAQNFVDGTPHKALVDVKGLVVPVDEKDEGAKDLRALGYEEVAIDLTFGSNWTAESGKLTVEPFAISGKDIGALRIAFNLGGVTPEFVAQLKAAEGDSNKQMELLQTLQIQDVSLRFDNASVVDRMLAKQAKDQGVSKADLVKQLGAMAPMMLAQLNNKEFEKKVADALVAFLGSPKSLTVSAKPPQAVPVAQLVGTVMVAPQTLPSVLAVDIQANK